MFTTSMGKHTCSSRRLWHTLVGYSFEPRYHAFNHACKGCPIQAHGLPDGKTTTKINSNGSSRTAVHKADAHTLNCFHWFLYSTWRTLRNLHRLNWLSFLLVSITDSLGPVVWIDNLHPDIFLVISSWICFPLSTTLTVVHAFNMHVKVIASRRMLSHLKAIQCLFGVTFLCISCNK